VPVFTYKAYDAAGAVKSGIEDADTARDARLRLRRKGLHVTDIEEIEAKAGKKQSAWSRRRQRRKTSRELPQVTRQLATLMRSGIPLNDGLKALVEQVESRTLEVVLRDVRERINTGASFAEALEQHPGVFPPLYVSMMRAGEAAGNSDVVLERLASFMMRQAQMKNQVMSALMYPIIMLAVGAVVVSVLMIKVVPELISLVEAQGAELPMPTAVLKSITEFVTDYWPIMITGVILANMLLTFTRSRPQGRYATDRFLLNLPVVGDLFKKQAIARFSTTLSTLLKTGVPVLEAIKIVREIIANAVLQRVLDQLHAAILRGADISSPLKSSGVFPPAVGYMIAVGEQSGELEQVLDSIAEAYEVEVDIATQRMTALLEPIMILLMAGLVAFIVMAVVLPMLELGTANI
jgi:general secretion pathway protein F